MADSKLNYSPVLEIALPMAKDISEVLPSIEGFVASFDQPMIVNVLGDKVLLILNVSNRVLKVFEKSKDIDTSWLKKNFTSDVNLLLVVQLNKNEAGRHLQFKVLHRPLLLRAGQKFLQTRKKERGTRKIRYEDIAAISMAEPEESSHTAMSQQQTTKLAYPVPQQLEVNAAVADRGPAGDVLVVRDSSGYLVKVTGDKFNVTVTEGDRVHLDLKGTTELVEVLAVTGDLVAIEEIWYHSERGRAIEMEQQRQGNQDLVNAGGFLDLSF